MSKLDTTIFILDGSMTPLGLEYEQGEFVKTKGKFCGNGYDDSERCKHLECIGMMLCTRHQVEIDSVLTLTEVGYLRCEQCLNSLA